MSLYRNDKVFEEGFICGVAFTIGLATIVYTIWRVWSETLGTSTGVL